MGWNTFSEVILMEINDEEINDGPKQRDKNPSTQVEDGGEGGDM